MRLLHVLHMCKDGRPRGTVNMQLLLLCVFYETMYIKPAVAAVN